MLAETHNKLMWPVSPVLVWFLPNICHMPNRTAASDSDISLLLNEWTAPLLILENQTPANKRVRLIFKLHKKQLKRLVKIVYLDTPLFAPFLGKLSFILVDNFYLLLITSYQKQAVFICQSFTCELLTRKWFYNSSVKDKYWNAERVWSFEVCSASKLMVINIEPNKNFICGFVSDCQWL